MTATDIVTVAQYLGLTPSTLFPLIILGGVILWVGFKFVSPISKSVKRITNACIEIQTVMSSSGNVLRHHLVEAPGSPLQPTQYGKTLISESGLEKILNDEKESLKERLTVFLNGVDTEYDVQEKARDLLVSLKDTPMMASVKNYAYQHGLNVEMILKSGGLWLRDDYLGEERKVKSD